MRHIVTATAIECGAADASKTVDRHTRTVPCGLQRSVSVQRLRCIDAGSEEWPRAVRATAGRTMGCTGVLSTDCTSDCSSRGSVSDKLRGQLWFYTAHSRHNARWGHNGVSI